MQLAPNGSIIEGVVREIAPGEGGLGRELVVDVESARPQRGKADFSNAACGDRVTLFVNSAQPLEVGQRYKLATTVLGGPGGERTVVEKVTRPARARKPKATD